MKKIRKQTGLLGTLIGLALFATGWPCQRADADELREEVKSIDTVSITNWKEGFVDVTGNATARYTGNRVQEELMARSAARLVAHARLVEVLKGLRITGTTKLQNMIVENQIVNARFEGFIKGAITLDESVEWRSDSSARRGEIPLATVRLRLCMARSHAVCRDQSSSLIDAIPKIKTAVRVDAEPMSTALPVRYTGLIVDLGNALFLPVLLPEIISRSGHPVYSRDKVSATALAQSGVARYVHTVDEASRLSFVGDRPLIVKIIEVTNDNKIVVSARDAETIQLANRYSGNFLSEGRVVIALD